MFVISAALGKKYYAIPYDWRKIGGIILSMLLCYVVAQFADSLIFDTEARLVNWSKMAVHTLILLAYIASAYFIIRKNSKKGKL